jgi:peptidoglycan/xylan/chitin deacetylase (PgdA/CDA1 family)
MKFASNPRAPFRMSSCAEPLTAPGGKPLVVQIVVNVEYWPYDELTPRTIVVPPHGLTHVPDLPNFCWSEYGNRCGMPRLLKLFSERGLPVGASVNASVIDVYPEVAEAMLAAGWEFIGHGYRQRGQGAEEDERAQIDAALDRLSAFTGARPRGWMSPGWSETFDTLDHLRGAGIEYVCQWVIDDVPVRLRTAHGDMVSLPYGLDHNDSVVYAIEKQPSEELRRRLERTIALYVEEIADTGQPRVLTIPLHPHLAGVPHRFLDLKAVIDGLIARDDVVFMGGSQILDWYLPQSRPLA